MSRDILINSDLSQLDKSEFEDSGLRASMKQCPEDTAKSAFERMDHALYRPKTEERNCIRRA